MVATAQMVGGIVAAAILKGLTPGDLSVSVALGQGTNRTQGLFIEMFTTAALVLSVLMLAAGESYSPYCSSFFTISRSVVLEGPR
jgi:aquaporin related protein